MKRIGKGIVWSGAVVCLLVMAPPVPLSGPVLWGPPAVHAAEDAEAIRKKFEVFAASWMEKLRERERFNASKAKWKPAAGGVEAVYIGYDTAGVRILPLSNVDTNPIGKLVYLELKLRLAGSDEASARAGQPQIIERVEVTELFRYHRGKWVY